MGKLLIGTSGYQYKDWEKIYYPEGLKGSEHLGYYSQDFHTVELNFTYYALPNPFMFQHMVKKVCQDFVFSLKAHKTVTHSRDYKPDQMEEYFNSLKPLAQEGLLGCILVQFPWSFKYTEQNRAYLQKIGRLFAGFTPVVEFRNSAWATKETVTLLKEANIAFCNVDEPGLKGLFPPTAINTTSTGYIRFHGRNAANWWNPGQAYRRYDYNYSKQELLEWLPRIKKIAANTEQTFIYFNNHYKAQAVQSAKTLISLLKEHHIVTSQN